MKLGLRQGARFATSGGLAFVTDASVLAALTRGLGIDPFSARIIAIACAMVVGFFAHRRISFAIATPPTLSEFAKFLSVAFSASVLNYAVYAGVLLLRPGTDPLIAMFFATAIAMAFSYVGYRFGVFKKPPT